MRGLNCFAAICALLATALAGSSEPLQKPPEGQDTQTLTAKLRADLAEVWAKYAKKDEDPVRKQAIQNLNTMFTTAVTRVMPPPGMTMQKSVDAYIAEVDAGRKAFNNDVKKDTLTSYVTSCNAGFQREFMNTVDYKKPFTSQYLFNFLVDAMDQARRTLKAAPADVQNSVYSTLNSVMSDPINRAVDPPGHDYTKALDENFMRVQKLFPTTTPELQNPNGQIRSLMESTARLISQLPQRH